MPDIPFGLNPGPAETAPEATHAPGTAVSTLGGGVSSAAAEAATGSFGGLMTRGVVSGFRRASNDIQTATGLDVIKNNMKQILGVRSGTQYTVGELPWRTEFGSQLHVIRHQNNGIVAQELARIHVVGAITRWAPRVLIKDVKITKEVGPSKNLGERPVMRIHVVYDIRATRGSLLVAKGESLSIVP